MQPFSSHTTKVPVAVEGKPDASALGLGTCQSQANDTKEDACALAESKQEHKRRGEG